jgi:hypothetical protein
MRDQTLRPPSCRSRRPPPPILALGLLAALGTWGCQNSVRLPASPDVDGGGRRVEADAADLARSCVEDPDGRVVSDALRARAAEAGSLRIIARLRVAVAADPDNPAYLASIRQVQDAVIAELGGRTFSVTARFQTVPLLGLQVSAAALDVLAQSAHVACVQEDALARPMGTAGS